MEFEYNWMGSLATLLLTIVIVAIGRFILFSIIPAFKQAKKANAAENHRKLRARPERYRGRLKSSQVVALTTNIIFFAAVLPFFVTFEAQPASKIALDVFLIMMIYDFFYYLTHRFLFHSPSGYFRKVHAVHHQARTRVSSVDSLLLHPWEAFIGIALFFAVTAALGFAQGQPFSVITMVISTVIYTQINQVNHCRLDMDRAPFKYLHWIALSHDAHHINMHKGNYATITLLYDWLFRTLEPVNQQEQVAATEATPPPEAEAAPSVG